MPLNLQVVPHCQRSASHEIASVAPDEFGHTQAILVWKFGLQEDLQLLRRHLPSLPIVRVVHDLVAEDLELDLTGLACLLTHQLGQFCFFRVLCSSSLRLLSFAVHDECWA